MALHWRTVTGERNPRFLIKGVVLANALCGKNSRFLIEETRAYPDGQIDRAYRVRDAETVSDVDIRAGVPSKVVARFDSEAEAVAYCMEA